VREALGRDGVEVVLAAQVERVQRAGDAEVEVFAQTPQGARTARAARVMLATNRRPAVEQLDLAAGGIEGDDRFLWAFRSSGHDFFDPLPAGADLYLLKNVLADPMVRIAMAADRVDPQEFATMLAAVAQTLERSPPLAPGKTPKRPLAHRERQHPARCR